MSPARPPEGARTAARQGEGTAGSPARPPEGAAADPARIADALAAAAAAGLDRLDAHLLMAHLLQQSRTWVMTHDDDALAPPLRARWQALVARRAAGEPLAYLTGDKEFHGLSLRVGPAVLVPRPDTETLVDWALDLLPLDGDARLLDLGTGSGAIVLALRYRRPRVQAVAIDASEPALTLARSNGDRHGLPVDWRLGSWWLPLAAGERFDLIVSNPPYIAEGDPHLEALRHEPRQALTAGADGMSDLHHIVEGAPRHLSPGGWLLLEHGHEQAPAVADALHRRGFSAVATRPDLAGRPRCTGARWTGSR